MTAAVAVLGLVATLPTFSAAASAISTANATSTPTSSIPASQHYRVDAAVVIHAVRLAEVTIVPRGGDFHQCTTVESADDRAAWTGISSFPVWMEVSNTVLDGCAGSRSFASWTVEVKARGVTSTGNVRLNQISSPFDGRSEFELTCDGGFVNATCQNSSQRTVEFNMTTLPPQDPTLTCDRTVTGKVGVPFTYRQFCTYGGYPVPTPAIYGTLWKVDNVDRCYDAGDKCFPAGVAWRRDADKRSLEDEALSANGTPTEAGQYGVWIALGKDLPRAKDQFVTFDIAPAS